MRKLKSLRILIIMKIQNISTEILTNWTSTRAKIKFSLCEHTAVDIGVYAHSNTGRLQYKVMDRIDGLAGAHESTYYPKYLRSIVDLIWIMLLN